MDNLFYYAILVVHSYSIYIKGVVNVCNSILDGSINCISVGAQSRGDLVIT